MTVEKDPIPSSSQRNVTLDPGFRVKPCHPLLYPRSRGQKDGRRTVWPEAPLTAAGRFLCIFDSFICVIALGLWSGSSVARGDDGRTVQ